MEFKKYQHVERFGNSEVIGIETEKCYIKNKTDTKSVDKMIEERIVDEFVTSAFIEKEYSKIVNDKQDWSSIYIPMLISKIFYELINEEMWNILKKFKNPVINFKVLNTMVVKKVKMVKPEIFK